MGRDSKGNRKPAQRRSYDRAIAITPTEYGGLQ